MVKQTMLVLLSSLYIAGCSSTNWVKLDKSNFTSAELKDVLKACNYNEAMKNSKSQMLSTTNEVKLSSNVSHNELDEMTSENGSLSDNLGSGKANSDTMHNNMNSLKDSYDCMRSKGFIIKS